VHRVGAPASPKAASPHATDGYHQRTRRRLVATTAAFGRAFYGADIPTGMALPRFAVMLLVGPHPARRPGLECRQAGAGGTTTIIVSETGSDPEFAYECGRLPENRAQCPASTYSGFRPHHDLRMTVSG
jgi:hypothetical protein